MTWFREKHTLPPTRLYGWVWAILVGVLLADGLITTLALLDWLGLF